METSHVALHLSRKFTRRVLVVQPRRADGTFQSPVELRTTPSFGSFHLTVNGVVTHKAR